MASCIDRVYVATCDREIADAVRGFGGNVVMTSEEHHAPLTTPPRPPLTSTPISLLWFKAMNR